MAAKVVPAKFRQNIFGGENNSLENSTWSDVISYICDKSSVHGFCWYNWVSSHWLKSALILFVVLITFGLPIITYLQLINYMTEGKLNLEVHWSTAYDLEVNYMYWEIKYF